MQESETERTGRRRSLLVTLLVAVGATLVAIVTLALVVPADPAPPVRAPGQDVGLLTDRPAPTQEAPLPAFELERFDGEGTVRAADYAGQLLIINFWATWCAPCVEEMPDLQEAADEARGDVAFLGVNLLDQHDKAVALVESLGVSYDLAIDREGRFADEVELFGMPTTLFVDASGMIRYRHTGPLTLEQVQELSRTHLGLDA